MEKQAIAVRLREWREGQRLTLEEVADLLGISASMLSRLERGERGIRPLDRVRFARLLGARVSDLFPVGRGR
ncbi:MAG: helix-turn-helix domain-containing protein [Candidatus Rokuibacteriota bacterium]